MRGKPEVAFTRQKTPKGSADDGKRLCGAVRFIAALFVFSNKGEGSGGGRAPGRGRRKVGGFMLGVFFDLKRAKTHPRRAKTRPRRPKTCQDAPKTLPRRPQDAPRRRQEAQDAPKTLPRCPKRLPKRPRIQKIEPK